MSHFDPARLAPPSLPYRDAASDAWTTPVDPSLHDTTSWASALPALPDPMPEPVPTAPRWTPVVLPGGAAAAETAALATGETATALGTAARIGTLATRGLGVLSKVSFWLPLLMMKGDAADPPGRDPWSEPRPVVSPLPPPHTLPDAGPTHPAVIPLERAPAETASDAGTHRTPDAGTPPAPDGGPAHAPDTAPLLPSPLPPPGPDAGSRWLGPGPAPDAPPLRADAGADPIADDGGKPQPLAPRAQAEDDAPAAPESTPDGAEAAAVDPASSPDASRLAMLTRDPAMVALELPATDALLMSFVAAIADGSLKPGQTFASQTQTAPVFETTRVTVSKMYAALERLKLLELRDHRYVVSDTAPARVAAGVADRLPLHMRTRLRLDAVSSIASGRSPANAQLNYLQMGQAFASTRQSATTIAVALGKAGLLDVRGPRPVVRPDAQARAEALLSGALRHFRVASPRIAPVGTSAADALAAPATRPPGAMRADHPGAPMVLRTRLLADLMSGRLPAGQPIAEYPGPDLDAALASFAGDGLFTHDPGAAMPVATRDARAKAFDVASRLLSAAPGASPSRAFVDLEFLRDAAIRACVAERLEAGVEAPSVQRLQRRFHVPASRVERALEPWRAEGLVQFGSVDLPITSPLGRTRTLGESLQRALVRHGVEAGGPPVPKHTAEREAANATYRTHILVDILDRNARPDSVVEPARLRQRMTEIAPVDPSAARPLVELGILRTEPQPGGHPPKTVVSDGAVEKVQTLFAKALAEPHGSPLHRLLDLEPLRAAALRSKALDWLAIAPRMPTDALTVDLAQDQFVSQSWARQALQPLTDRLRAGLPPVRREPAPLPPLVQAQGKHYRPPTPIRSPSTDTPVIRKPPVERATVALPPLVPSVREVDFPMNEIDAATVLTVQALADGALPTGRWFTSRQWAQALGLRVDNVRLSLPMLDEHGLLQSLRPTGSRATPEAPALIAEGDLHALLTQRGQIGLDVLSALASGQLPDDATLDRRSLLRFGEKSLVHGLRALRDAGVLSREGEGLGIVPGAAAQARTWLDGVLKPFRMSTPTARPLRE